jgi:hypothetical protein
MKIIQHNSLLKGLSNDKLLLMINLTLTECGSFMQNIIGIIFTRAVMRRNAFRLIITAYGR